MILNFLFSPPFPFPAVPLVFFSSLQNFQLIEETDPIKHEK